MGGVRAQAGNLVTARLVAREGGLEVAIAFFVFFQAEDGIRDFHVTGAQTCALPIWQRGLWDSAIAEIGVGAGIFQKHNLELQVVYTSGGGETQQAVISGSVDIGVSPGMLGVLGAYVKGAPVRVIAGEATGT